MLDLDHLPAALTRRDASEYLERKHGVKLAPATLASLASLGNGPLFRKDGRRPDLSRLGIGRIRRATLVAGCPLNFGTGNSARRYQQVRRGTACRSPRPGEAKLSRCLMRVTDRRPIGW